MDFKSGPRTGSEQMIRFGYPHEVFFGKYNFPMSKTSWIYFLRTVVIGLGLRWYINRWEDNWSRVVQLFLLWRTLKTICQVNRISDIWFSKNCKNYTGKTSCHVKFLPFCQHAVQYVTCHNHKGVVVAWYPAFWSGYPHWEVSYIHLLFQTHIPMYHHQFSCAPLMRNQNSTVFETIRTRTRLKPKIFTKIQQTDPSRDEELPCGYFTFILLSSVEAFIGFPVRSMSPTISPPSVKGLYH